MLRPDILWGYIQKCSATATLKTQVCVCVQGGKSVADIALKRQYLSQQSFMTTATWIEVIIYLEAGTQWKIKAEIKKIEIGYSEEQKTPIFLCFNAFETHR